jgi:hypothetical protein
LQPSKNDLAAAVSAVCFEVAIIQTLMQTLRLTKNACPIPKSKNWDKASVQRQP